MADISENTQDFIESFDDLRAELLSDDATCYLLEGDGETEAFKVKKQLTSGWYLQYVKFRGHFELFYATADADFDKTLSLCGYVAISGEVYEIDDGDTVPPQNIAEPFWTIVCHRIGTKKFTAPTEP